MFIFNEKFFIGQLSTFAGLLDTVWRLSSFDPQLNNMVFPTFVCTSLNSFTKDTFGSSPRGNKTRMQHIKFTGCIKDFFDPVAPAICSQKWFVSILNLNSLQTFGFEIFIKGSDKLQTLGAWSRWRDWIFFRFPCQNQLILLLLIYLHSKTPSF